MERKRRIAILGGGPSGLFAFKRLTESDNRNLEIEIFEQKTRLGSGMPYSAQGANEEHITNVSDNEIPHIVTSVREWITSVPANVLLKYKMQPHKFNEYKVLPRLLFGLYLSDQFDMLLQNAKKAGIATNVNFSCKVTDIIDKPAENEVWIEVENNGIFKFDQVIVTTGHIWPKTYEGAVPGYYDAPYPPSKLVQNFNHSIAVKGSSLTAIDAMRTLARSNGEFRKNDHGVLTFMPAEKNNDFKIVLHSRSGLLPAVRFHLEDSHLANSSLLTETQLKDHMAANGGFLSLDFLFEQDFKEIIRKHDPEFYIKIREMRLEEFVASMMELRLQLDPFILLKAEYKEAEQSIKRRESVYWKEMLAILSFTMNYPAKHFSAEDMLRLQNVLMPLISIVIAFIPQSSCEEILALHNAGVLSIISVGEDSHVTPEEQGGITYQYVDETGNENSVYYHTFVNCVGQSHLSYEQFPFKSLLASKSVSPAQLKFKSAGEGKKFLLANKDVSIDSNGDYYLTVAGVAINDNFQILDHYGAHNDRIFMMAVPLIAGYNPDYSGLDFCAAASQRIANCILANSTISTP